MSDNQMQLEIGPWVGVAIIYDNASKYLGGPYLIEVVSAQDLRYVVGYLRGNYGDRPDLPEYVWTRELAMCPDAHYLSDYCEEFLRARHLIPQRLD